MHVKEATMHGERALRLHHVAVWHELTLFSPRERAALAWTELLTQLPPHGVPESGFLAMRKQFSKAEVAEPSFDIVAINGWNRLSIGVAIVPARRTNFTGWTNQARPEASPPSADESNSSPSAAEPSP